MAKSRKVLIPYAPRAAFSGFHERSQRWACIVAHRRAGKTVAAINELIRAAFRCERPQPRLAYPIPYKSSIHITLTNPASGSANSNLWSHVTFNQGNRPPYKLWSSGETYINRTPGVTPTQQGNGTIQYLNLAAGNRGVVVYHGIFFTNPTNQTYLENNIVAYLNGTLPGSGVYPQYNSSGTEDYFQSSFYFPGNISEPWMTALVGTQSGNSYSTFASLDLLALHGGIKFNNGILMRSETGQAAAPGTSTTNVDENWLVLYYMPY
jgi:hypothetical protein